MKAFYGRLPQGEPVHLFRLGGDGLRAEILDYGAILRSLSFPGARGRRELILGLPDLDAYVADRMFLGIVAGRFANRIDRARCTIDGVEHRLSANQAPHHLHGGHLGLGKRRWAALSASEHQLILVYRSPDGEEGYPGELAITAEFRLEEAALTLTLRAETSAPTPVNLTHHPYFNLAGDPAVAAAAQQLQVPADRYLPVADSALIPTGEIATVEHTALDFRGARPLHLEGALPPPLAPAGGYDHCLVMAPDAPYMAELYSPHSGIRMRIQSNMPALQLYGGQAIPSVHPGIGDGICLEPQGFPDAPNRPQFPNAILQPGEVFENRIRYEFSNAA